MKRIFVTGASGFIGSAVVHQLINQGREVAILLRPNSNTDRIIDQIGKMHIICGNLDHLVDIKDQIANFSPDAMIHLAWDGVKGSERNSEIQIKNVFNSIALYGLAESLNCKVFIGLGSQAEYGPTSGKLNEKANTHPTTLYGATKLSTGLMIERIAATSNCAFSWLRLFSSYGPGDDPSWLLQYVTNALLNGNTPALTKGEQMWDYIHVNDVVSAIIATLDSSNHGIFNLGSGVAHRLSEIISTLRDFIDPSLPLGFGEVDYRSDQVMHLEADITALKQSTGWTPTITLDHGLQEVINWQKEHKF